MLQNSQTVDPSDPGFPIRFLRSLLSWPLKLVHRRRRDALLKRLSDHDLRDIGISRDDIAADLHAMNRQHLAQRQLDRRHYNPNTDLLD